MRSRLSRAVIPVVVLASVAGAQSPPPPPTPPTPVSQVSAPVPPSPPSSTAPTPPAPPSAPSPITAADVDREAVISLGRAVSIWANMGAIDSLISRADQAVGTPEAIREKLTTGLASFAEQVGSETKVSAERVMLVNGQVQYWRTVEYSAVPVPLVFRVMVGRGGKWRGFTVTPEEQLPTGAEEVKRP